MSPFNRIMSIFLFIIAGLTLIAGIIFIQQGVSKYIMLKQLAATEKVSIALTEDQIKAGKIVDDLTTMQAAADLIRSHRQHIAQTYDQLLGGKKYNPTNPKQLLYSQAINLENYLYLGVLSFGTVYLMMGIGAFMILMAISVCINGLTLARKS